MRYAADLHHGLPAGGDRRPRSSPPRTHTEWFRTAASPYPPGWSWWSFRGYLDTDVSRAPSRLACRTRPVWQSQTVPALSGPLAALPGTSRVGCPQLPRPAATGRRWWSFTSTRSISASWRTPPQDRACGSSPHTAQASHKGSSGAKLQHGATGPPPRGLLPPAAGGVYEVCPGIVPGGWLAVGGQAVRRDRHLDDLQEPAFPALR